jgi:hypothetical protein
MAPAWELSSGQPFVSQERDRGYPKRSSDFSSGTSPGAVSVVIRETPISRGDTMEGFDRRKFLKGSSVAAGLAGAMTVLPGALPAFAKSQSAIKKSSSHEDAAIAEQHASSGDPVVVHVRDARTGQIDLFVGTKHFSVQDKALASRILSSAR